MGSRNSVRRYLSLLSKSAHVYSQNSVIAPDNIVYVKYYS